MTSDWIMVIMTLVYVVATILICIANFKSSKATREQTREQQRQFEELNRPSVSVYFDVIRTGLATLKLKNNGKRLAKDIQISLDETYISTISNERVRQALVDIQRQSFDMGVDQNWHLFLGVANEVCISDASPLTGSITYTDGEKTFSDTFHINLSAYGSIIIYDSIIGDICKHQKKIAESIEKEVKALTNIERTLKEAKP